MDSEAGVDLIPVSKSALASVSVNLGWVALVGYRWPWLVYESAFSNLLDECFLESQERVTFQPTEVFSEAVGCLFLSLTFYPFRLFKSYL